MESFCSNSDRLPCKWFHTSSPFSSPPVQVFCRKKRSFDSQTVWFSISRLLTLENLDKILYHTRARSEIDQNKNDAKWRFLVRREATVKWIPKKERMWPSEWSMGHSGGAKCSVHLQYVCRWSKKDEVREKHEKVCVEAGRERKENRSLWNTSSTSVVAVIMVRRGWGGLYVLMRRVGNAALCLG